MTGVDWMSMKIKSVIFRDSEERYGNQEAIATMTDDSEVFVFAWFDDEITFEERDLVGRTIQEARDFKQETDIAYLRS